MAILESLTGCNLSYKGVPQLGEEHRQRDYVIRCPIMVRESPDGVMWHFCCLCLVAECISRYFEYMCKLTRAEIVNFYGCPIIVSMIYLLRQSNLHWGLG